MLVPHGLDYHCFEVSFKIWKHESPLFAFFQDYFGYAGSLAIPYEFLNQLVNGYKEVSWDSNRDYDEFVDQFGDYKHFNDVKSYNLCTWDIFPIIKILFNFFRQCL